MAVLLNSAPDTLAEEVLPHKTWTRDELLLVGGTGVFEGTHFELIEGELIDKTGKKPRHVEGTKRAVKSLIAIFGEDNVLQEAPIDVAPADNARNEPEPDVIALRRSYEGVGRNPLPSEVALVVEIAGTSLRQDLTAKARLYARAGIAEYWVLDVTNRRLHVMRDPVEGEYQAKRQLTETESVTALERPGQSIPVAALLGAA